ncbi:MAG TPA: hypothetical protein VNP20_14915 [Nocardioidaceae bacterium]|nr:hypothetical protein [Nocardioidaceae bacterium]
MSELDPETQDLHDRQMAREATFQEAINAVVDLNLGHDVPAIRSALGQAIAARGLGQPAYEWLNAVAVEVSHGNRYVVGTRSEEDAQTDRDRRDLR